MKVTEKNIVVNSKSENKKELFKEIANLALELNITNDKDAVEQGLWDREAESSTGMEFGFAIPHAKTEAINKPAIVVIKTENTILDYEAFDNSKIKNCIGLLIPKKDANTLHLKVLSKIAVSLLDEKFRNNIVKATTKKEIIKIINQII